MGVKSKTNPLPHATARPHVPLLVHSTIRRRATIPAVLCLFVAITAHVDITYRLVSSHPNACICMHACDFMFSGGRGGGGRCAMAGGGLKRRGG